MKTDKKNPISDKVYLNTKEYFEQFAYMEETYIEEDGDDMDRWLFKKEEYKKKLMSRLPLDSFFGWCIEQFEGDPKTLTNEKIFAMTSLLFDEELEVGFSEKSKALKIITNTSKLSVPLLKIQHNGIPGKTQADS